MPAPEVVPAGPAASTAAEPSPLPLHLDARGAVPVAMWASALRCVLSYVLVPIAAPLLGSAVAIALPVVLALHVVGITAAGRGVARGVRADRWGTATLAGTLLSLNLLSLSAQLAS